MPTLWLSLPQIQPQEFKTVTSHLCATMLWDEHQSSLLLQEIDTNGDHLVDLQDLTTSSIWLIIFSLLVLKGIYHYWKYVYFFQGAKQTEDIQAPPGKKASRALLLQFADLDIPADKDFLLWMDNIHFAPPKKPIPHFWFAENAALPSCQENSVCCFFPEATDPVLNATMASHLFHYRASRLGCRESRAHALLALLKLQAMS